MAAWWNDFTFKGRSVVVKSTGAKLHIDLSLVQEILAWFPFYMYERARGFFRIPAKAEFKNGKRAAIHFLPERPRPWYLLWVLAHRAKARLVPATAAQICIYFEDKTSASPPKIPAGLSANSCINFTCTDISKSRVGDVFAKVFGYDLNIDPQSATGDIAVKSERNGAHDGYVTSAPCPPQPGMVYQRLINNKIQGALIEDLRCPIVDGKIELVFVKNRPVSNRFANFNTNVTLQSPEQHLSKSERGQLAEFARQMGLDFGGIDVLRCRDDKRIYVVDVNKTDMGPPIALSLTEKRKAVRILTRQFAEMVDRRLENH